jgi:hypothetical protein
MIKVYSGLKGFTGLFFFIAVVVLFLSIFCWGITEVVGFFLPVLIVVSYLLIIVFVLGFLPATFFKDLRPSLAMYSVLMSHALGVAAWMMSFIFVAKTFGFLGIFLAFLFQFLAPIAIVTAVLKSFWHVADHLLIWISFAYGMKFYSKWLLNLNPRKQQKAGNIIDVDAIEVRDH